MSYQGLHIVSKDGKPSRDPAGLKPQKADRRSKFHAGRRSGDLDAGKAWAIFWIGVACLGYVVISNQMGWGPW